jgi:glycosyltransferase involved in cell wall biosynthesis
LARHAVHRQGGHERPVIRLACFATQGTGSGDEMRIHALLDELEPTVYAFDRRAKRRSAMRLLARLRRERPDLVVMEGTGLGGGLALLAARALQGTPYVVSTGDAVGPFLDGSRRGLGLPFGLYERALLRFSAGVVGWSPYIVGRALTFGAPRAVTAAGWAPSVRSRARPDLRARQRLDLPTDALVFGLVGSLAWNRRYGYCYGLELVRALRTTTRGDLRVLVVGGGEGLDVLKREGAGDERLLLPGRVPREVVPDVLAAMDVASLPQSIDRVGSFRYSTKLSEYLAAGLPVVTGQIPAAYDLDEGWLWRLSGDAPWDERYLAALGELMASVTRDDVEQRRRRVPRSLEIFDEHRQRRRVTAFVTDIVRGSS